MRLDTDRLVLRPLSMDDLDALAPFYADPEVMRYIGTGATMSREEVASSLGRMIDNFAADGFGQLAVVRKDGRELIGRCGLLVWEAERFRPTTEAAATGPTELEVGYKLGRPYWRQGYATEAATAVRDYALEELGRRRLIALIRPGNAASARVAEKLGMRHERDVELMLGIARLFALEG